MGRRLDDTDLANLEAAAKGDGRVTLEPVAHPLDVLRLVEEVRWWKENCVKYVSELPLDDPRFAVTVGTLTFDRPGSDAQVIDLTEKSYLGPNGWVVGENPDPTIKASFAKAAEQIRRDCEPPKSGVYVENHRLPSFGELVRSPRAPGISTCGFFPAVTGYKKDVRLGECGETIVTYTEVVTNVPTNDVSAAAQLDGVAMLDRWDEVMTRLIAAQSLPKNDPVKLVTGTVVFIGNKRRFFPGNRSDGAMKLAQLYSLDPSVCDKDVDVRWFTNEAESIVAAWRPGRWTADDEREFQDLPPLRSLPKNDDGDTPTVVKGN